MNPGIPLKETTSWRVYTRIIPFLLPIARKLQPKAQDVKASRKVRQGPGRWHSSMRMACVIRPGEASHAVIGVLLGQIDGSGRYLNKPPGKPGIAIYLSTKQPKRTPMHDVAKIKKPCNQQSSAPLGCFAKHALAFAIRNSNTENGFDPDLASLHSSF